MLAGTRPPELAGLDAVFFCKPLEYRTTVNGPLLHTITYFKAQPFTPVRYTSGEGRCKCSEYAFSEDHNQAKVHNMTRNKVQVGQARSRD